MYLWGQTNNEVDGILTTCLLNLGVVPRKVRSWTGGVEKRP